MSIVQMVGAVTIHSPSADPYYRLKWPEPNGRRGDTTGGRELDLAVAKASQIDERLQLALGPQSVITLGQMLAKYLAEGRSPYRDKKLWKRSHARQVRTSLTRCLRGLEDYRAMDVDRALCDQMRAQAGTQTVVHSNTVPLRAFLRWGGQKQYLSPVQAELLPERCIMPDPALGRTITLIQAAPRRERARRNGEAPEYIHDEDAPSALQVTALSRELGKLQSLWGELAPELSCGTGSRWGEMFQLTADDYCTGCPEADLPHFHVDWQIGPDRSASNAYNGGRALPKGDKTRIVPVWESSFTGFLLRAATEARVQAARAEQDAGTNPQALLFPDSTGGLLWHTTFQRDLLLPAMEKAGWPIDVYEHVYPKWDEVSKTYTMVSETHRDAVLTWHSLRHRFARTCIDVKQMPKGALMAIGGWENPATVDNRYYRSGADNMKAGIDNYA